MKTILVSAAVSLVLALIGTPVAIRVFSLHGYGQLIREEGPAAHASKRGTPTMGGTVIIIASLVGYLVGHVITLSPISVSGVLVLALMSGLGFVGFVDDFIKIYKQRSLGLRSGAKFAGQVVVGVVFALLVQHFRNGYDLTPADSHISFLRDIGGSIGPFFVLWVVVMTAGASNAVNLTDGLDGLATGAAGLVLASYVLILWWNAPPARIFMGDTGSLALGGVLVGLAICTRTQLLLAILGGLFVIITLSVVLQVGSFKLTGKRVFRMAPLQHHFELLGWAETTIVVRFWLICGLFIALGLGVFYVEWMPK